MDGDTEAFAAVLHGRTIVVELIVAVDEIFRFNLVARRFP